MRKKFSLALALCLFLIVLPYCKKETPTTPEPPPLNLPNIQLFFASPSEIDYGFGTTLYWTVTNATSVYIAPIVGYVSLDGDVEVYPKETTVFTLTATNSDGAVAEDEEVTVNPAAYFIIDGPITRDRTSYKRPRFSGWVKNVGNRTGYNVMVTITCYSDPNYTNIIDTANGFPANLGNIMPNQRAFWEAVCFDLSKHEQIGSFDVTIEWLNAWGVTMKAVYRFR